MTRLARFEISVFPTGISVIKRAGNFAIWWTLQPSYRDESGMTLAVRIASSCIARCIFIIISIPFNSRDAALRVAEAMIGAKVINFVFRHVCYVSRIWRQNSSPGSLAFSCFGNRAEISHMNPRRSSYRRPSQPGQPRAHVKRSWKGLFCLLAMLVKQLILLKISSSRVVLSTSCSRVSKSFP